MYRKVEYQRLRPEEHLAGLKAFERWVFEKI